MLALLLAALVAASPPATSWRTVVRVVDGDTLLLDSGERVRLIGVDTPETVDPRKAVQVFGAEASAFTRREVLGRRVRLERGWERADRYGRTLAYVFRDDGWWLNAELLRQGYGHAMSFPHPHLDAFRQLEREARAAGRGLWAPSAAPSSQ
jgi:micrococcal nuclease